MGGGVRTKVEGTIWIDIADQHLVLFFFFLLRIQVAERPVSCQDLPEPARRQCAVRVPDGCVCRRSASPFPLFCLCHLRKTLLLSLPLLPTFPLFLHFPFPPSLPSHQPGAAMRGYRSSKAATLNPSLGSGWPGASGGGQGSRSLQHYLSQQQQQQHLHHQSTHTSYAYCPAHTAVSAGCLLSSPLSMSLSAALRMFFRLYPPSRFQSHACSTHGTFSSYISLSSRLSFSRLFPFIHLFAPPPTCTLIVRGLT